VKLRRPIAPSISKLLSRIAEEESIQCPQEKITEISQGANGDIRAAINDLQACYPGLRDREKDVFQRMSSIFRASSYRDAREASFGDIEHDFLKLWIDENIPAVYSGRELADAFSALSRADIFDGRIRARQHWGFLRYSSALMCAGVSFAREGEKPRFARFSFPRYLKQMGATVASRAASRSLLKKIGSRTHTASRDAVSFLPIISCLYASSPEKISAAYGFDEKEIAILEKSLPAGTRISRKKKKEKPGKEIPKPPLKKKKPEDGEKKEKSGPERKESAPPKKKGPHHSRLSEFF
jgi:replication factor C large subunit